MGHGFIILNRVGLGEKVTFEGRLEGSEVVSQKGVLIPGGGNRQCKSPEEGM